MSDRKKKRNTPSSAEKRNTPTPKEAFAKLNKKLILKLIINFVIVFGVYRFLVELGDKYQNLLILDITVYGYIAVTGILSVVFIIWNRGVSNDVPTKEQLRDDMTDEEKEKFITDLIESRKKAKKVLMWLIPFLFTLLLDAIVLIFFSQFA